MSANNKDTQLIWEAFLDNPVEKAVDNKLDEIKDDIIGQLGDVAIGAGAGLAINTIVTNLLKRLACKLRDKSVDISHSKHAVAMNKAKARQQNAIDQQATSQMQQKWKRQGYSDDEIGPPVSQPSEALVRSIEQEIRDIERAQERGGSLPHDAAARIADITASVIGSSPAKWASAIAGVMCTATEE